jgi:hypothetical protein
MHPFDQTALAWIHLQQASESLVPGEHPFGWKTRGSALDALGSLRWAELPGDLSRGRQHKLSWFEEIVP